MESSLLNETNFTEPTRPGAKDNHHIADHEVHDVQYQTQSTSGKQSKKLTKKNVRENEAAAEVVNTFDATSPFGKKIIKAILEVESAVLIKSTLSKHTTLKNYTPYIEPALKHVLDDLLIEFKSGAVVTSNQHRNLPVYIKKMVSPTSAKANLDLSKILKIFDIEYANYVSTWWNILLTPTITLSEEVYDLLTSEPYSTFITVPINQWAPASRKQMSSIIR
jgi:hypothetical protein